MIREFQMSDTERDYLAGRRRNSYILLIIKLMYNIYRL